MLPKNRSLFKSALHRVKEFDPNVELTQGLWLLDVYGMTGARDWQAAPALGPRSSDAALQAYASMTQTAALAQLQTSMSGLTPEEVLVRLKIRGPNLLSTVKPPKWWQLLLSILPNPFNILLALLAIISVATPSPSWSTFILLIVMIVISCAVRFWQEHRSTVAAIRLQASVSTNVRVRRQARGGWAEDVIVDEKTLVPGDILLVDPGDSIAADCMVLETSSLQINILTSLTGESEPLRKTSAPQGGKEDCGLFELENVLFMGTSVISGSATALVLRTGDGKYLPSLSGATHRER
ncbi:hypothetical protein LTR04_004504 [Oleoguttula sp. CCFEE 6159]|nr:hypothetical protein LTR04_004504 [Oleoguttula sp. CCFEE 6159]